MLMVVTFFGFKRCFGFHIESLAKVFGHYVSRGNSHLGKLDHNGSVLGHFVRIPYSQGLKSHPVK